MKKATGNVFIALIYILLYAPLLVMVFFSFNSAKSTSVFQGFSLKWYLELFEDRNIMEALKVTVSVAVIATIVSTVLGTLAAVGIHAMKKGWANLALNVSYLPMTLPDIVTGVSLMLLFVAVITFMNQAFDAQLKMGFGTLLIAHITFNIPYVILQVMPKLRQMDKHLYEAAIDLGCTPLRAFFRVVIPEILPGVFTGALMAFTLSLDDFVISYCTAGSGAQTLSVTIYSMVRRRVTPEVNAVSTLLFGSVLLLLIIINVMQIHSENKLKKEERRVRAR